MLPVAFRRPALCYTPLLALPGFTCPGLDFFGLPRTPAPLFFPGKWSRPSNGAFPPSYFSLSQLRCNTFFQEPTAAITTCAKVILSSCWPALDPLVGSSSPTPPYRPRSTVSHPTLTIVPPGSRSLAWKIPEISVSVLPSCWLIARRRTLAAAPSRIIAGDDPLGHPQHSLTGFAHGFLSYTIPFCNVSEPPAFLSFPSLSPTCSTRRCLT